MKKLSDLQKIETEVVRLGVTMLEMDIPLGYATISHGTPNSCFSRQNPLNPAT
jgi:hypothetical protein